MAMQKEMESLYKVNIWELCELSKGGGALTAKWIYKQNEAFSWLKIKGGKYGWLFEAAIIRKIFTLMKFFLL